MHLGTTGYIMPFSFIIHKSTVPISLWLSWCPVPVLRLVCCVELGVIQRPYPCVCAPQPNPDTLSTRVPSLYDLLYVSLILCVVDCDQICVFLSAVSLSVSPAQVLIHKVIPMQSSCRQTDHS